MNKKNASLIRAQDEMDGVTREGAEEAGLSSNIKAVKRADAEDRRRENNARQREDEQARRQARKAAAELRRNEARERRQWREYDTDRRAAKTDDGREV